MNVGKMDKSSSFQGLNYRNATTVDRKILRKNFRQLKELGQKYDIKFVSTYAEIPEYSAMDIYVRPLKDNLNFWQKFFRPKGESMFQADKNTLMESVYEAINDLLSKTAKKS